MIEKFSVMKDNLEQKLSELMDLIMNTEVNSEEYKPLLDKFDTTMIVYTGIRSLIDLNKI